MSQPEPPRRRVVLAYGGLVFAVAAPIAYVAQRLYGRFRATGVVNPAIILRTSHVEYYWRVAVATWFAVAVAILIAGRLAGREGGPGRLWTAASGVSVILCVVLAWLYP